MSDRPIGLEAARAVDETEDAPHIKLSPPFPFSQAQKEIDEMTKLDVSDIRPADRARERSMSAEVEKKQLPFVAKELQRKADLFAERYAVYGDNYHRFGPIITLLFATQNLDVTSPTDMSRYGLVVQVVSKLTRYCEQFTNGGHPDSLDDISVYSMMLKEIDTNGLKTVPEQRETKRS